MASCKMSGTHCMSQYSTADFDSPSDYDILSNPFSYPGTRVDIAAAFHHPHSLWHNYTPIYLSDPFHPRDSSTRAQVASHLSVEDTDASWYPTSLLAGSDPLSPGGSRTCTPRFSAAGDRCPLTSKQSPAVGQSTSATAARSSSSISSPFPDTRIYTVAGLGWLARHEQVTTTRDGRLPRGCRRRRGHAMAASRHQLIAR